MTYRNRLGRARRACCKPPRRDPNAARFPPRCCGCRTSIGRRSRYTGGLRPRASSSVVPNRNRLRNQTKSANDARVIIETDRGRELFDNITVIVQSRIRVVGQVGHLVGVPVAYQRPGDFARVRHQHRYGYWMMVIVIGARQPVDFFFLEQPIVFPRVYRGTDFLVVRIGGTAV